MNDLSKYTEAQLREELKNKEENRKSNGKYKCFCQHCGKLILSRYPTTNCCDECAH